MNSYLKRPVVDDAFDFNTQQIQQWLGLDQGH